MLDNETKRRIDTARDILVGKLPDPKSQVEQITIALIYKFMDDMDAQSVEYDGEPSFFVGDYEKYGWRKIFAPNLSGHERLSLYGEAIVQLNQNPNLPQLFRDIFKNAYLPYRDPETLTLFLKTINEFKYDHSERLGDAFEYLLSVLGSQGDAGQFRTPRHIIEFIVKTLAPKKNETICDPACGTAGFLISSYKHILKSNTKQNNGDMLTPDDRRKLMQNFIGYDISPDMVRLSLVNLYLHGFPDPHIYEYDTLTSEDRWNETFDIIMANPPFMSPKGGIKPHKKFSIAANRSEVLFVDYIAEHIHPTTGRAGIIVPEGIIFQSAGAYKDLRKMLVDKAFLYAVVSLPAGVFQPYSGVKTSILLMDKTLAGKTDKILFVKIQNDGFGLGAQRRQMQGEELTDALNIIKEFQAAVLNPVQSPNAERTLPFSPRFAGENQHAEAWTLNEDGRAGQIFEINSRNLQTVAVEKTQIAANGDYNLSGDRYKTAVIHNHEFEIVKIDDVVDFVSGLTLSIPDCEDENGTPIISMNSIKEDGELVKAGIRKIKLPNKNNMPYLQRGDLLFNWRNGSKHLVGKTAYFDWEGEYVFASFLLGIRAKPTINSKFLWHLLNHFRREGKYLDFMRQNVNGLFNREELRVVEIPLPPLSIQKEIVEKIEGFQRIIDGAKQVVENYKPQIDISPDWEMVELGEVVNFKTGKLNSNTQEENGIYPFFTCSKEVFAINSYSFDCEALLLSGNNASGDFDVKHYKGKFDAYQRTYVITVKDDNQLLYPFTRTFLESKLKELKEKSIGGLTRYLTMPMLTSLQLPLPPLEVQQEIVVRIEREQSLVNSNKELITIFEAKIKDEINKLWEN